jgi:transcription termination/antitermination protein NusA
VLVDDDNKQATVVVPDDQLSLAIGKEGQNARLAARLTGWRVDIKSESEFADQEAELGIESEEDVSGRCHAILSSGKRCPNAALPGSRYCGLPAHQAMAEQEQRGETPVLQEEEPAEAPAAEAPVEAPAAEAAVPEPPVEPAVQPDDAAPAAEEASAPAEPGEADGAVPEAEPALPSTPSGEER